MISREQRTQYPEVDWSVYDHQQDPTPQKDVSSAKASSVPQKGVSDYLMQGVDTFNQSFKGGVVDPALGFMEETANMLPGAINLLKHHAENNPVVNRAREQGKYKNSPDVPYFNQAPNNMYGDAGRALSLALGGKGIAEPALKLAEKGIKGAGEKIGKAYEYLNPKTAEKMTEEFRGGIGEGTSSQNIENLGRRAQMAKSSSEAQALIPKNILHAQEGRSDVYKINKEELPEGNLPSMGHMIDPGAKFNEKNMTALSNALSGYRKGKIDKKSGGTALDTFLGKAEDIFNVPELTPKQMDKIEDVLSMPTKRDSRYFADKKALSVYRKNDDIREKHDAYEAKPILGNYQILQSAIKKEQRALEERSKTSSVAAAQLQKYNRNIKNLNADKENFMQTLPEDMQNLDNQFRHQYQEHMSKFEKGKKGIGPSETLRNLAEGKHDLVTDAQVQKVFAHPTAADKKIILDMGPSAAKNALYSAIQRVKEGDAESMANTILDLKRTKGFDNIITKDIEDWANNMLQYLKKSESMRGALKTTGKIGAHLTSMGAGALMGGPVGALAGLALPSAIKGGTKTVKYIAGKVKK